MLTQVKQLPLREEDQRFLQLIEQQAKEQAMTLGVFGSFSVGKSALINALLGQPEFLPTHTNETTALPTHILYGEADSVEILKFDGTCEPIDAAQMRTLKAGGDVQAIERVIIRKSQPDWLKDITLIDTPGRNTKFQAHVEASEEALITSDAVLYVMSWQGLTLEDVVYIKHILRYQPNLYFVINKVDHIDEAQGVTIEEMTQRVQEDLEGQLGKVYPVYAVSARTGYQIERLQVDFLQPLKQRIKQVKATRFQHALEQLLNREQERILQQIQLFEQATNDDTTEVDAQKRDIQLQFEQAQIQVEQKLEGLHDKVNKLEVELSEYVRTQYRTLETRLKQLASTGQSLDVLTVQVESAIVSTRNEVFGHIERQVQGIIGQEIEITIQPIEQTGVQLQIKQPDLAQLQLQYEEERQKQLTKIEVAARKLEELPEDDEHDFERARLKEDVELLTERTVEQFVPQYVLDESFDANQATKIASAIGFVGDMALTVGLAVATAGGSAAVQVGGKVAAKAAAKEAMKVAAKKVALEVAEKAVVTGIQTMTEANKEATGTNSNNMLTAAKALDQFTSPVQSIAKKIGENIDSTRQQPKREDLNHRKEFYARKYELESERDEKMRQLKSMEEKAKSNLRLRQELEQRRIQVEKTVEQKIGQLETDYENRKQQAAQAHLDSEIEQQLKQLLQEEERQLTAWFKTEFGQVLHVLDHMLPKQLHQELAHWEEQIEQVEALKKEGTDKLDQEISMLKQHLNVIDAILSGGSHVVSV